LSWEVRTIRILITCSFIWQGNYDTWVAEASKLSEVQASDPLRFAFVDGLQVLERSRPSYNVAPSQLIYPERKSDQLRSADARVWETRRTT
jgi:hypothetical protein